MIVMVVVIKKMIEVFSDKDDEESDNNIPVCVLIFAFFTFVLYTFLPFYLFTFFIF